MPSRRLAPPMLAWAVAFPAVVGIIVLAITVIFARLSPMRAPVPTVPDVAAVCEGTDMHDCPGQVSRAVNSGTRLLAICSYVGSDGGVVGIRALEDAASACDASVAGIVTEHVRVVRLSPTALVEPFVAPTPPVLTGQLVNPEIGVPYSYVTFTHCSFIGIVVDGEWWMPIGGPIRRNGPEFDFNFDHGTVELIDRTHATYRSSTGHVVRVERWEGPLPSIAPCM